MDEIQSKIDSAIRENDIHLQRLDRAKRLLAEFFPLTEGTFQSLTEEQIEHIDQFVYRFTKLQDSMGTRLLPAVYSWLEADSRPVPFLDILSRLEQLRLIEDASQWQFFRNLRNNLAHDYPESVQQTVETLNLLFQHLQELESMYSGIREACIRRMGEGFS
ncbi:MAG: hypothetical protein V5B78_04485 [Desulfohalobiaceae bacterium]